MLEKQYFQELKKVENNNTLIIESECQKYDLVFLRNELLKMFKKYQSNCYSYGSKASQKTISNYDLVVGSSNLVSNPILNIIANKYDSQVYAVSFYRSLICLSDKLLYREAVYLINAFLTPKSEEDIAELIGISKTSLQKYKKSCIVKTWIELEEYFNEGE